MVRAPLRAHGPREARARRGGGRKARAGVEVYRPPEALQYPLLIARRARAAATRRGPAARAATTRAWAARGGSPPAAGGSPSPAWAAGCWRWGWAATASMRRASAARRRGPRRRWAGSTWSRARGAPAANAGTGSVWARARAVERRGRRRGRGSTARPLTSEPPSADVSLARFHPSIIARRVSAWPTHGVLSARARGRQGARGSGAARTLALAGEVGAGRQRGARAAQQRQLQLLGREDLEVVAAQLGLQWRPGGRGVVRCVCVCVWMTTAPWCRLVGEGGGGWSIGSGSIRSQAALRSWGAVRACGRGEGQ